MKTNRRTFLIAGFSLVIATILDAFWIESFFVETSEFDLRKSPGGRAGLKVVQLSDLHLNSVRYQHKQLAKKLNALQPDLLLFTGDSIDQADHIDVLNSFLGLLDRKIKKAAITGNWEYWGNIDLAELQKVYSPHNCDLLINESRQYQIGGHTVSVTGVDDFIGGNADIRLALEQYQESAVHIILNHCPEYYERILAECPDHIDIDLVLSGHTHGGQINIFGFAPFLPRGSGKYLKGWYRHQKADMYVSRGIGTSILPVRFGARAEVAVFTI